MSAFEKQLLQFLDSPWNVATAALAGVGLLVLAVLLFAYPKYVLLVLKSLGRNKVRTGLTAMAVMLMVLVLTLVWSVLTLLNQVTAEKSADLKAVITEKWQIPSQMPFSYAASLSEGAPREKGHHRVEPQDSMTWQFYGGTTESDPARRTRDSIVFFFCMDPDKLMTTRDPALLAEIDGFKGTSEAEVRAFVRQLAPKVDKSKVSSMMDGLDTLSSEEYAGLLWACRVMGRDKNKVILGKDRLKGTKKQVGDTISVYSFNYKGIDITDLQIIGVFPEGRYNNSALMNRDRLNDALDAYKQRTGTKHELADKSLNLVWLRVKDPATYSRVADQVMTSPEFGAPAVKCETGSSGIATFLDAYRDILWLVRWVLIPAVMATMALVISVAISISVRERRTEMAVLKVLGFGPWQILALVMGEAMVVGLIGGLLSAGLTYFIVNYYFGGVAFPIAFFPQFTVPLEAFWWGLAVGGGTAFLGSVVPAWSARSVKVSEVFAKTS